MGFFNNIIDFNKGLTNYFPRQIIKGIAKGIYDIETKTPEQIRNETINNSELPEWAKEDMKKVENIERSPIQTIEKDNTIKIPEWKSNDIKDIIGIKEENEEQGNNQSIEDTQNNSNIYTPSIKELWEREDAIRKETQEREDTAYQRAVEDMRKAGINPNLVGINPANSGGGITQATGQQILTTEMSNIIEKAVNEINNTVKKKENTKDRITEIIETVIRAYVMYKSAGLIKK